MKKQFTNIQLRFALRLLCAIALTGIPIFTQTVLAAGPITGTVFRDYDGDGVKDTLNPTEPGVRGVIVNAYDTAGALAGTATSAAGGAYTIASVTGNVRVEFIIPTTGCDLDSNGTFSGSSGNIYGTSVRFVAEGATNVNYAVSSFGEYYTSANPFLGVPLLIAGNPTGGGTAGGFSAFEVFANNTDSNAPIPASRATTSQIGAVWGNAYSKQSGKYFVSSLIKRHAGMGPLGASGIYTVDPNTAASGSNFIDLSLVGSAASGTGTYPYNDGRLSSGTNNQAIPLNNVVGANTGTAGTAHRGLPANVAPNPATTYSSYDAAAFEQAGKLSFGGLEISPDGQYLYAVNLFAKTLVRIDLQNPASPVTPTAEQVTSYSIPDPTCVGGNFRPWAAKYFRGKIYVGGICDAQTTGVAANLKAYVYEFNPTTLTFNSTPVINGFGLDYTKGSVINVDDGVAPNPVPAVSTKWYPWTNDYNTLLQTFSTQNTKYIRPQPILSDIDFDDADGSLILAFTDRTGLQTGYRNWGPRDVQPDLQTPSTSATNGAVEVGGGDVLRFYKNPTGCTFVAESGGISNGVSGSGAGNSQGPGGGEFFGSESYNTTTHSETIVGSLAVNYGSRAVAATNYDAFNTGDVNSGGVRRFDMATGGLVTGSNGYNVYNAATRGITFAKGVGLGDLEMLTQAAPVELGNRVWRDTDNDGVQDPGETGINNVTVRLYNAANVLIATAVTNSSGEYYFVSGTAVDADITNNVGIVNGPILPNTNYQIRFDNAANYTGTGTLTGLLMTTRDQTSQLGVDDASDSDGSLVTNPTNSPAGTFPVISVTTGASGENNHNLDVGFASSATYSIGNRVWFDTDNNGQIDAAEFGMNNITLTLLDTALNPVDNPNIGGIQDYTITTDTNGYYRFDTLPAGNYVVRINATNFIGEDADTTDALVGYRNTTNSNATDLDSTSVAGQNGENGIDPTGAANIVRTNGILSATIALGAPGEPVSEADVQPSGQGAIDAAANMTVDFGFYRLNLSGTVWRDTGAGANNNNGTLDAGEAGVAAVIVRLYDSANVEIPVGRDGILGTSDDAVGGMNTDGNGNYNFQGLPPGTYRVVVTPNGATSSTPTSTNPDDNVNSNDDGTPQTAGVFNGRITSGLVTLTPGNAGALNNNTILNTNGSTTNPTVDFGLIIAPTAVGLESFDAFADTNGNIILKWSTGNEADNLGFNVYREVNGKRELLNRSPIAGSALRSNVNLQASGDSYSWTDAKPEPGAVYYLEDIDLNGSTNLHGAVSAKMQFLSVTPNLKSRLLSDLAEVSAPNQSDSTENASVETKAGNKTVQNTIAAQTGVKITVKRDGWYRISTQQLQAAGFEVNSNQAEWQMFANGEEVPFKLTADNSVEFFGRGLDTLSTDQQVYYLTVGDKQGQRITEVKGGNAGKTADANSFRNVAVRRDRGVYASAILNGEAENWFGAVVSSSGQTAQDLTVYNPDTNGGNARLSVKLQGLTNSEHLVSIRFNDLDLGAVNYSNRENRVFEFDVPMSSIQSGTNRVSLQAIGAGSDVSVVDSITLNYARFYKVENDRLRFTVPAGQTVRVGGFSGEFEVYEIRGGKVSTQIAAETEKVDGTPGFSMAAANSDREFLAVGKLQNEPAVAVENDNASDWRNPSNKADFVIITPNSFRESAARLAQIRQSQGLKTEVVAVEDLYDEFTFGTHSPVAVQEFLRTATSQWKVKPQYALLFGDSSYDSRNYLGGTNRDLVPTKLIDTEALETASDALLADFDNDGIEDIALGRLPVVNQTEAAQMISKIQRYESVNFREERSNLFVSDTDFENYSNTLNGLLPADVSSSFVNRTGTTDSEMRQSLLEKLNQNTTVVTYSGHGSNTLLTNSSIFRSADALNLNNQKLSFYLMMTCLNGFTHNPSTDSLAESLMKSGNGAIAVWASSGTTNADGQSQLSQAATNLLFNAPQPLRIGAIVRNAKQATGDQDIRRTWQLIGDPTIFIR